MTTPPFGRAQLWHAVRILVACAIAYAVSRVVGLPEGYWSLITVFIVTQSDLQGTVAASRIRIIGTLIGAAMGTLAIVGESHGLPVMPLYAICLVPLVLLTAAEPALRLSCITLTIVVLATSDDPSFVRPLQRVAEILIGTLAALLVSLAPAGLLRTR